MKDITLDTLHNAAHALLFEMTESEYSVLLKEMQGMKAQINALCSENDLADYKPMTFPFECEVDSLREDEAEKPLDREEALSNASSVLNGGIKIPKVVG